MCKTTPAVATIETEHDPADTLWSPTLGDIFRRYGPGYRRKYAARMPRCSRSVVRSASAIARSKCSRPFSRLPNTNE